MAIMPEDWIICWFLPLSETNGLWQIDELQTKNHGMMMRYDVQQLYKMLWLRTHDNTKPAAPAAVTAPTWIARLLYLLQQTINGITIGCLYALLAVAFNLIYGIVRFINLAFGELYMIGAFATYLAYVVTIHLGGSFTLAADPGDGGLCHRDRRARRMDHEPSRLLAHAARAHRRSRSSPPSLWRSSSAIPC